MGMSLDEVFEHYHSLDPQRKVSSNATENALTTVTYSQFKTICGLAEVRMAEFKKKIYSNMPPIAEVVGNKNMVIRLGKKATYFEAFDLVMVEMTQEKIEKVCDIMREKGLFAYGFRLMKITFNMPVEEEGNPSQQMLACMVKFVPPSEKPNEFFGYIV